MIDPSASLASLLYNKWSITDPAEDSATAETTNPSNVHFTNRYFAVGLQSTRIHTFQISCLGGNETARLIAVPPKYEVNVQLPIHVWALVGMDRDVNVTLARMRNMMKEVARIINANRKGIVDLQDVDIGPGWLNKDELDQGQLVFHRYNVATGTYYEVSS